MQVYKFGAIQFKSKSKGAIFLAKKYPKLSQIEIAKKIQGESTLNSANVIVHTALAKVGLLRKETKAGATA